jgi:hypothetical protein
MLTICPILLASSAQAQFTYVANNGTITITGYSGSGGNVTIPGTTNGLPVVAIGNFAFADCASLTSVTISESVTSVGTGAFESCTSLTNANIPDSVTNIAIWAFDGCSSLPCVIIPGSVANIGSQAFADCTGLTNIAVATQNPAYASAGGVLFDKATNTLIQCPAGLNGSYSVPGSVTNIGSEAFFGCSGLTDVTLGNGVTGIGGFAFLGCSRLTNVTIPGSVTNIGSVVFENCTGLTNIVVAAQNPAYASAGGVLFDKATNTLIECPAGFKGSYSVPGSVTNIGSYAFWACSSLTNVTLGNSLTSIGSDAFSFCNLTSVTIPNSVTSIGSLAFDNCYNLTSITVAAQNPAYASVGGVLFDKATNTLLECPGGFKGSYSVPGSVTNIGSYAFSGCSSLTNVALGNSLTSIGTFAFEGCYLTSVTIPSVTTIGDSAFWACSSLTNVTLGNGLTSIGNDAFAACNLTSVTIPSSVTNIGTFAFEGCFKLAKAFFQGTAPYNDGTAFLGDSGMVYYVPGTAGWGNTFGGCPTAPWFQHNPQILGNSDGLGVRSNQFGFTVSWATNTSVVVQACTDLANPVWTPVATGVLSNGVYTFSDPQWTNYPSRFYRVCFE